jgi:hypothetical protein
MHGPWKAMKGVADIVIAVSNCVDVEILVESCFVVEKKCGCVFVFRGLIPCSPGCPTAAYEQL